MVLYFANTFIPSFTFCPLKILMKALLQYVKAKSNHSYEVPELASNPDLSASKSSFLTIIPNHWMPYLC